jgi:hypothetical protein
MGTWDDGAKRAHAWAKSNPMVDAMKLASNMGHPRFGDCLGLDGRDFGRVDVDEATLLAAIAEANHAGDLGEEGVVLAAADVFAGLERGSTLANDDAAAEDGLAAEYLNAEPLCV